MELRHLRYFVAVAEELHVTRAAERLGISQPPLTQQIKALERELGVALFARSGRGIVLTGAGQTFLAEARAILDQVRAATNKARRAGAGELGRLSVGFTEVASFNPLVTETFRGFQARFPEVTLTLREAQSTELITALAAGELDFAFVRPPFPEGGALTYQRLSEEEMVVALPAGHPLANAGPLSLADLAAQHFIHYPRLTGPGLADEVIGACRAAGFTPRITQVAPKLSSTINMVAAGMGISIVPNGLRQVRPNEVRFLPLVDLPLKAYLGLAGHRADTSPLGVNFRAAVESCRAGLGPTEGLLVYGSDHSL